jgi:hypothetical protein
MPPNQVIVPDLAPLPLVAARHYAANTAPRGYAHPTRMESRGVVLLHLLPTLCLVMSVDLAVRANLVHMFRRLRRLLYRQVVGIGCKDRRARQRSDQAVLANLLARTLHILLIVHRLSRHLVQVILRYLVQSGDHQYHHTMPQ